MSRAILNNKTQLNKALSAERKSMREKQKQSAFMRKTLSIYGSMLRRAAEWKQQVEFSLETMRNWAESCVGGECWYCKAKLTVNTFTFDHDIPVARGGNFSLKNMRICCKSCNWQKGTLNSQEFSYLLEFIGTLPPLSATDIKRRLTIGGKWAGKL